MRLERWFDKKYKKVLATLFGLWLIWLIADPANCLDKTGQGLVWLPRLLEQIAVFFGALFS